MRQDHIVQSFSTLGRDMTEGEFRLMVGALLINGHIDHETAVFWGGVWASDDPSEYTGSGWEQGT